MEKKKLNVATIEAAINNKAIVVNENDKSILTSFIMFARECEDGNVMTNMFINGHESNIAALIASRMNKDTNFRRLIYRAVCSYERVMNEKIEKAFSDVDKSLGTLIDNFEEIFGKKPSNKKRMRKQ